MDVLRGYNLTRFMAFVPKIRKNINEWRIIDVFLTGKTNHNAAYIALKLKEYFGNCEGIIFICNSKEILVLAHTGKDLSGESLSEDIHEKMPKYSCDAHAEAVTADGLLKIQIRLQDLELDTTASASALAHERKERKENVIMVVEDDLFMRSVVVKTFQPKGRVLEFGDTSGIIESYLQELPDIVFLDIHLPGGSGIKILEEIMSFDGDAYVVMLSADSVKDNVLSAQKSGAQGFLAKPFTPEKLISFYNKCPTVTQ